MNVDILNVFVDKLSVGDHENDGNAKHLELDHGLLALFLCFNIWWGSDSMIDGVQNVDNAETDKDRDSAVFGPTPDNLTGWSFRSLNPERNIHAQISVSHNSEPDSRKLLCPSFVSHFRIC